MRLIQDTCAGNKRTVLCALRKAKEFVVRVGVHQRLVLNARLFALLMDYLVDHARGKASKIMIFVEGLKDADDIVLCNENLKTVEEHLEKWRRLLKDYWETMK